MPATRTLAGSPRRAHAALHILIFGAHTCTTLCTLPCRTRTRTSSSSISATSAATVAMTAATTATAMTTASVANCMDIQWQHSAISMQKQPQQNHPSPVDSPSASIADASARHWFFVSSVSQSCQPCQPLQPQQPMAVLVCNLCVVSVLPRMSNSHLSDFQVSSCSSHLRLLKHSSQQHSSSPCMTCAVSCPSGPRRGYTNLIRIPTTYNDTNDPGGGIQISLRITRYIEYRPSWPSTHRNRPSWPSNYRIYRHQRSTTDNQRYNRDTYDITDTNDLYNRHQRPWGVVGCKHHLPAP